MGWKDKVSSKVWGKIISKKTADKSPFDLAKSELDILKAKEKAVTKLAKDVKDKVKVLKKAVVNLVLINLERKNNEQVD